MSLAMSPSLSRSTFALQSRLFVAMKRAGRVIDLVWFQHSAEYAQAVLDTAGRMSDAEVRELAANLRGLLGEYLVPAAASAPAPVRPAPTAASPAPATVTPLPAALPDTAPAPPAELDRHLTSLR